MPKLKSAARAVEAITAEIPTEITEIRFRVFDASGAQVGDEQLYSTDKPVQFSLAANRSYTVSGTANAGEEVLFAGSESIPTLAPGETRRVPISLLAKIKVALSVASDLVSAQDSGNSGTPVQLVVGTSDSTRLKLAVDGLRDPTIHWSVNDIIGGNEVLGQISSEGAYTPPALVPQDPNIRIKAEPAAARSFAAVVSVKLVAPPEITLPASSATPPGGNYSAPQDVALTCNACSAIHFTLDGTEPTLESRIYADPIHVATDTQVRFFATNTEGKIEAPRSENYQIQILTAIPTAPANVIATAGDGQIGLTWSPVSGATGYRVFHSTSPDVNTSGEPAGTLAGTSFTSMGLANGTTYYFKIVATNIAGSSPDSAEVNAKPRPPLPEAPANFAVSAGDAQVALSWGAAAGATEYRLYRGTSTGVVASGAAVATVATTTFTNLGLINGTTYYFKVVAANLAGPGVASLEISAKPLPPLPAAPTKLSATAGNTQVTLLWTPVTGATEYRIFRGTAAGVLTNGQPIATSPTNTFTNTGLTNGTRYYYKVVAANLAGPGPASLEVSAIPVPSLPLAPNNVTATSDHLRVTLNWTADTNPTGYTVYRGTAPNVPAIGASQAVVTNPPFIDNAVINNTTYYYKVTATNLAGEGPASVEVSAKPLPPLPTSLNQALFQPGTTNYVYALPPAIPNIAISGAPADTDGTRWTMLHDTVDYRLYFFKAGTTDTLYQFAFNPATQKYEYGYNSIKELRIVGANGGAIPSDVDSSSFSMLYDKGTTSPTYRLYMRSKADPKNLHQFSYNITTQNYEYGLNSIPVLSITGGPLDTDYSRWAMLHDGASYRYYAFQNGSDTVFYQFSFNAITSAYEYAFNSIPVLNIVNMPANSNTKSFAMLHEGTTYHFYFQTQ